MNYHQEFDKKRINLRANCKNCFGLCCVALYFSVSEGFPIDKEPGKPCINLQPDFSCCVHQTLQERGLKGCIAFDCFGAGPKVAQFSFGGIDWSKTPENAQTMFNIFLIMRQVHELLWYLTDALTLAPAAPIYGALRAIYEKTEGITYLSPARLMEVDVAGYRSDVNKLLIKTSELVRADVCREQNNTPSKKKKISGRGLDLMGSDLRGTNIKGANLRGAYLIATDLRGVDLSGVDLIGADLRDANISGANLTNSIFLTQAQINSAKGDTKTMLPKWLTLPKHWENF